MIKLLLAFLVGIFTSSCSYAQLSTSVPELSLSANSTTIEEGQPIHLTCNLNHFEPPNEDFQIYFEAERTIGFFHSMPDPVDPSGGRSANFVNMPYPQFETFGEMVNATSYEMKLVPQSKEAAGNYTCRYQSAQEQSSSNSVTLS